MSSGNGSVLRKRWWLVLAAVVVALGGAFIVTKLIEPQYKATCRLFVAVSAATTPAETYQAGLLSQERVVSYISLIQGERVAQSAIESLHLDMSPTELADKVEATAELKSVVINVSVTDPDAGKSAVLANAVCDAFRDAAKDIEAPTDGGNPQINVKVVERASVPTDSVSPVLSRNLAVGLLAGLFLGVVLVLALERIAPGGPPSALAKGTDSGPSSDAAGLEARHAAGERT